MVSKLCLSKPAIFLGGSNDPAFDWTLAPCIGVTTHANNTCRLQMPLSEIRMRKPSPRATSFSMFTACSRSSRGTPRSSTPSYTLSNHLSSWVTRSHPICSSKLSSTLVQTEALCSRYADRILSLEVHTHVHIPLRRTAVCPIATGF